MIDKSGCVVYSVLVGRAMAIERAGTYSAALAQAAAIARDLVKKHNPNTGRIEPCSVGYLAFTGPGASYSDMVWVRPA